MKNVNIIVAVDGKWGFAKNGRIPWNYPQDLKHFKNTTKNHACIMGRTTFEDMANMRGDYKGCILPSRFSVVLTSDTTYEARGAITAQSLKKAIKAVPETYEEIFVIGGLQLFTEAFARTKTVYVTKVSGNYNCDKKFPYTELDIFNLTQNQQDNNLTYKTFSRKKSCQIQK